MTARTAAEVAAEMRRVAEFLESQAEEFRPKGEYNDSLQDVENDALADGYEDAARTIRDRLNKMGV